MTHRTASMVFDLPQPLGPTMPTNELGILRSVGSTNDLNPAILIRVNRIKWCLRYHSVRLFEESHCTGFSFRRNPSMAAILQL